MLTYAGCIATGVGLSFVCVFVCPCSKNGCNYGHQTWQTYRPTLIAYVAGSRQARRALSWGQMVKGQGTGQISSPLSRAKSRSDSRRAEYYCEGEKDSDLHCTCTIAGPECMNCFTAYTEYVILRVSCIESLNLQVDIKLYMAFTLKNFVIFADIELIFIYVMRNNERNTSRAFPVSR